MRWLPSSCRAGASLGLLIALPACSASSPPLVPPVLPAVHAVSVAEVEPDDERSPGLRLAGAASAPETSPESDGTPVLARRYALRLKSLPLATATLESHAKTDGRRALSLRAEPSRAARLFEDTQLDVEVLVDEDRRPVRAITEERSSGSARRTLLAFERGSGSVVVKETGEDGSRVRLLQGDSPWEPLSLLEAVAHLPWATGSRTFDVLLRGRIHRLKVAPIDSSDSERHLRGEFLRSGGRGRREARRPLPIDAWFDRDGALLRATIDTPLGSLELVRAGA